MEEYQARDIQKIVGISKHHYQFIAEKCSIEADIEPAEGQGKVKRYSFTNLVEFALAHQMRRLGISSARIRKALDLMKSSDGPTGWGEYLHQGLGLFNKHKDTPVDSTVTFIFYTLNRNDPRVPELDPFVLKLDKREYVEIERIHFGRVREEDLVESDSSIRLNVGAIKARILSQV